MDDNVKKILTIVAVIAVLYILLKYILPILLKFLGFALSAFFSIFIWVVIGLAILIGIGYIANSVKK